LGLVSSLHRDSARVRPRQFRAPPMRRPVAVARQFPADGGDACTGPSPLRLRRPPAARPADDDAFDKAGGGF